MVGSAGNVVKTWDVAMDALVNTKEPEEVRRRGCGGRAAFAFPERCAEVVAF